MSKFEVVNSMTRTLNRVGFQLKKHSPEILAVAGAVGVVASGVMACKATTKLNGILEDSKKDIDTIHGYVEEVGYSDKYSEEDVAEMRYWQEMNKSENRHKDLSKQELISELSKYDIKFSTASKKEELRKLLVSLEDSCTPKKPVEQPVSKGRKPRIDKEFKRVYGHLSKAELIKLAKSKKIEVLPTESMNDIIKKIESKK